MCEFLAGSLLGGRFDAGLLALVSATDASTSFGFGASVARVPIALVEELAKLCEKRGGYVTMDGVTEAFGGLPDRFGSNFRVCFVVP